MGQLVRPAGGDDHLRAGHARKLHRGIGDTAAGALHQHGRSGPDGGLAENHAPGGQIGGAQHRRLIHVGALREPQQRLRRDRDIFGEGTVAVFAQDTGGMAERLVAAEAGPAGAAEFVGVEDHPVARRETAACGGFRDFAGAVDPHDKGQPVGDAGAVVAHVEIDAVHRGRVHPHPHPARRAIRQRHVGKGDARGAAFLQNDGLHRESSLGI